MRRLITATTLLLGLLGFVPQARANLQLGIGASGNFGLGDNSVRLPRDYSIDGVLGYRIGIESFDLTPEIEFIYLGSPDPEGSDRSFQLMGGGKLGYRYNDIVPSLFLHFGMGDVRVNSERVAARETGPAVEAGLAFDIWIRDALLLGAHVGANAIRLSDFASDDYDLTWLRAGVRLSLSF